MRLTKSPQTWCCRRSRCRLSGYHENSYTPSSQELDLELASSITWKPTNCVKKCFFHKKKKKLCTKKTPTKEIELYKELFVNICGTITFFCDCLLAQFINKIIGFCRNLYRNYVVTLNEVPSIDILVQTACCSAFVQLDVFTT